MEIYDVIKKLVGPIEPVGETRADDDRFENLKIIIAIMQKLIYDLKDVASHKDCQEYSRSRAGTLANNFLLQIETERQLSNFQENISLFSAICIIVRKADLTLKEMEVVENFEEFVEHLKLE